MNSVVSMKDWQNRLSPGKGQKRIRLSVFNAFRAIIFQAAGIELSEKKVPLLEGRLSRRLRALNIGTFDEYLEFIDGGRNKPEMVQLLNCISTNETTFFREPHQYEYLEQHVFPQIHREAKVGNRSKVVKVWSAACSSGDELYSAAMSLLAWFPANEGWTIDAIGTDISTKVLDMALKGVWSVERAAQIPTEYLKRFMLRGTGEQEGTMAAGEQLRQVVRFRRLNLFTDTYPEQRNYDVIFCRNVMIYFNQTSKITVVNKLVDALAPGGYLLVGHAETLHGIDQRLKRHISTIYSRR